MLQTCTRPGNNLSRLRNIKLRRYGLNLMGLANIYWLLVIGYLIIGGLISLMRSIFLLFLG